MLLPACCLGIPSSGRGDQGHRTSGCGPGRKAPPMLYDGVLFCPYGGPVAGRAAAPRSRCPSPLLQGGEGTGSHLAHRRKTFGPWTPGRSWAAMHVEPSGAGIPMHRHRGARRRWTRPRSRRSKRAISGPRPAPLRRESAPVSHARGGSSVPPMNTLCSLLSSWKLRRGMGCAQKCCGTRSFNLSRSRTVVVGPSSSSTAF